MPGLRIWPVALFVALVTLVVYMPALGNSFLHWDDNIFIYNNSHIGSLNPYLLKWMFQFYASNWIPLTWLSLAVDHAFWGLNPTGYHLTNIVLHSTNTFLVCLLVAYLVFACNPRESSVAESWGKLSQRAVIAGGITALLFGIHPVHVESVAWAAERKDVLSTFFVLLTLIAYAKYAGKEISKQASFVYYLVTLFCFVLSLMSKPMAVTLPVILVILDVYPFRRFTLGQGIASQRKILAEKIPFFLLSAMSAVLTMMAQRGAMGSFTRYPFYSRIVVAIKGLYFYIEKMVFPVGLSPFYPFPAEGISLFSPNYLIPIVIVLLTSVSCVWMWKRGKEIFAVIWVCYVVMLLPVLGIIQVGSQMAADRYAYIPSIGPFLFMGLGAALGIEKMKGASFSKGRKAMVIVLPVMIFSLLGVLTVKQIKVWKNTVTLWTAVLQRFPDLEYAYLSRAEGYAQLGKYREAILDVDRAIMRDPQFPEAYNNRGLYNQALGDYQSAMKDLSKAMEVQPHYVKACVNRAALYVKMGNYPKALEDLQSAIQWEPKSAGPYLNVCEVDNMLSRFEEAVTYCSEALERDPGNFLAYKNRGFSYNAMGRFGEAISDYTMALAYNPRDHALYSSRGIAYKNKGEHEMAVKDFTRTIELNPAYTEAYIDRGVSYGALGRVEDSIKDFTRAIELNPKKATAYYNRGASYYKLGRKEEAMGDFRTAAGLGDMGVQRILKERGVSW